MIESNSQSTIRQFSNLERGVLGIALYSVALLLFFFLSGCTQTCNIPTERSPSIRIVNAMPDQPAVRILLGGHLVNAAYPYLLPSPLGYSDSYSDGSLLKTGYNQKLLVVSAASDTLIDTTIALNDHRHTLILLGKRGRAQLKILLFDDEINQRIQTENLIRFVDAVTDLPALDVYLHATFSGYKPDFQLHYGDSLGYSRLDSASGLAITAAGDTNDVIFTLPYPLKGTSGFFITVLLRGEKHPTGSDPIVGTDLLSDQPQGNVIYQVHSFGVRFVNATRGGLLSLEVRGPADHTPRDNVTGQTPILLVPIDSVTDWAPFNPDYHGNTAGGAVTWFFAKGNQLGASLIPIDSFPYTPAANVRYTMIAMDDAPLGQPQILDSMILTDTIAAPPFGTARLRIVNLSQDHNFSFTLGGTLFTMPHRDVEFVDVPAGAGSFQLFDAKNTSSPLESVSFTLPSGVPSTLFLMPDNVANQVPYKVGVE